MANNYKEQLSFSELNSIESKESIEFVEDYFQNISFSKLLKLVFYRIFRICRRLFLVIFIFKTTKNSFLPNSIESVDSIEFNSEKLECSDNF